MATLYGVIAIAVCILLVVAVGRNKLAARAQNHSDSSRDGID